VIKTVAFGVVCLAGLGAIATAPNKPAPLSVPDVAMPVAVGNRADRLPIHTNQKIVASADTADIAYVPTTENDEVPLPQSAVKEIARPVREATEPRHFARIA
jgi:hypothetical protein